MTMMGISTGRRMGCHHEPGAGRHEERGWNNQPALARAASPAGSLLVLLTLFACVAMMGPPAAHAQTDSDTIPTARLKSLTVTPVTGSLVWFKPAFRKGHRAPTPLG